MRMSPKACVCRAIIYTVYLVLRQEWRQRIHHEQAPFVSGSGASDNWYFSDWRRVQVWLWNAGKLLKGFFIFSLTPKLAKRKGTELHLFNPLVIKLTMEGGMNTKLRAEAARGLLLWQEHFQMKSSMMTTNIVSRIFRLSVTKKLIQRIRLLRPEGKRGFVWVMQSRSEIQLWYRRNHRWDNRRFTDGRGCKRRIFNLGNEANGLRCIQMHWNRWGLYQWNIEKFFKEFVPQTG